MDNKTLIVAFVLTLPLQLFIMYGMYLDTKDYKYKQMKKQNSLNNLLCDESLEIELTEEDLSIIDNIIALENVSSIEELIRKEIKNLKGA